MSDRNAFVEFCVGRYSPGFLLKKAEEKAKLKAVDSQRCYCTGFTNTQGSTFSHLIQYWLSSLVLTHPILPMVRIVYQGDYPSHLENFPNIVLVPQLWTINVPDKGVSAFNFATKIQSLIASDFLYSTWIDADILFAENTFQWTQGTGFVAKRRRVAGGFYCFKREDKLKFFEAYIGKLEVLVKQQDHLNSDQKVMRKTLEHLEILWTDIGQVYEKATLHLSRSVSKQEVERIKYKTILENLMSGN